MIEIDLITGFLGAGKTTFIKQYVGELNRRGQKVGIIENDFGGLNVDMLLLDPLQNELCVTEQILSDGDRVTYQRRLKAKLIAMAMQGFKRIVIEPSGVFDIDAFLDTIYDEPVDRWYQLANVIAIVDANLPEELSKETAFMMTGQIAHAGKIIISKCAADGNKDSLLTAQKLNKVLAGLKCSRSLKPEDILQKSWEQFSEEDYENLFSCGYKQASYEKYWLQEKEHFSSLAFLEHGFSLQEILEKAETLLREQRFGKILRVKGFVKLEEGRYKSVNLTANDVAVEDVMNGQEVLTVIGEQLNTQAIKEYLQRE